MTTLTATVDTVTHSVRLAAAGGTAPYVVDASPGNGRADYRVRTVWVADPGVSGGFVGIDGDVPLNTPTVYVVTDARGVQAQSAVVTVAASAPVLSDSTDPFSALDVVVKSQKPNQWQARSVWWDVLGARAPFASSAPLRFRNGDLVLYTVNRAQRAALIDLLAAGNPFTLRAVCPDAIDDVIGLVERVAEELIDEDRPAGPSLFTLTYQAVARELGPYAVDPGRSYTSITAGYATYADVKAGYATYAALRAGDPGAGLGPELIANGNFSAGSSQWGTPWTQDATVSYASGTALITSTAPANNAIGDLEPQSDPFANASPGRRYRVTGRVRCSQPATNTRVLMMTNTRPGLPAYFEPGVALQEVAINPVPGWTSFAVDFTIPAGDDIASVHFRADALANGSTLEWDDLSARERL